MIDMARSVVKTEDNQQSQPQVLKQEAMEQDIQTDPVQSSSVVGEDTTVWMINRKSHCHIMNQKDFRGSEEEKQWKFDQTDGRKFKNMFEFYVRKVEVSKLESVGTNLITYKI